MRNLVFLLEEPSAREMLKGLLEQFLPGDINVRYIVFDGKMDLKKQLVTKLRGWQAPHTRFVIILDQDTGDCFKIKENLLVNCKTSTKSVCIVRIACRELEAFYLGDLHAVETGLSIKGLGQMQLKAKYRNPDNMIRPSEELMRITDKSYQKVSGSRAIGPHLDKVRNTSPSFKSLVSALERLFQENAWGN